MMPLNQAQRRLKVTKLHLLASRLSSTSAADAVGAVTQGCKFTADFKQYATIDGKVASYFHDVPLQFDENTKTANMVVEIPRWTNGKFEISTTLPGNPIVQDVKKGKVRFVKNLFPNHGYIHNYGAFPQTWEDPTTLNEELQLYGDNDPLDVCEIGANIGATGEIKRVRILGSLALIDDGELDWKIIAIDVNDPLSHELHDIHDVFVKCPGLLETLRQWFKDYKLPDGKPENKFAFNGAYRSQEETIEVVKECVTAWQRLKDGKVTGDNLPTIANTTLAGTPGFVTAHNVVIDPKAAGLPDAPIDKLIDRSYYNSTQ